MTYRQSITNALENYAHTQIHIYDEDYMDSLASMDYNLNSGRTNVTYAHKFALNLLKQDRSKDKMRERLRKKLEERKKNKETV